MKTGNKPKIKNLLWATDFSSESKSCLPYVGYFSQKSQTVNYALYVLPKFSDWVYEASFFSNEDLFKEIEKTKKKSMTKMSAISRDHKIDFKTEIVEGVASEEIIRFADKKNIDMIFSGRRGISDLEQLLVGSTTSRIIRKSHVPVFLVPGSKRKVAIKKILTPIDFDSSLMSELKYSIVLARQLQAKLYVAHVSEFFSYRVPVFKKDKLAEMINQRIERVAGELNFKVERVFHEVGEAAQKIVEISNEEEMDLIVMTTHQRKGIEKFFLGSVTEKVLMTCETPLLVVPHSFRIT